MLPFYLFVKWTVQFQRLKQSCRQPKSLAESTPLKFQEFPANLQSARLSIPDNLKVSKTVNPRQFTVRKTVCPRKSTVRKTDNPRQLLVHMIAKAVCQSPEITTVPAWQSTVGKTANPRQSLAQRTNTVQQDWQSLSITGSKNKYCPARSDNPQQLLFLQLGQWSAAVKHRVGGHWQV